MIVLPSALSLTWTTVAIPEPALEFLFPSGSGPAFVFPPGPGPAVASGALAVALALGMALAASTMAWRWHAERLPHADRFVALAAVALGLVTAWRWRSPTVGVGVPLLAAMAVDERMRRGRRHRQRDRSAGMLVVVDTMTQELRSGSSLHAVCCTAAGIDRRVQDLLNPMAQALARRRPLAEATAALAGHARGSGSPELVMLATALATVVDRGAPAVPALQRLRLGLMAGARAREQAAVQASQALASAALLAVAPALFTVVIVLADSDAAHLYLREPLGAVCVSVALIFSFAGWRWMDHSISRAAGFGSDGIGSTGRARSSGRSGWIRFGVDAGPGGRS